MFKENLREGDKIMMAVILYGHQRWFMAHGIATESILNERERFMKNILT